MVVGLLRRVAGGGGGGGEAGPAFAEFSRRCREELHGSTMVRMGALVCSVYSADVAGLEGYVGWLASLVSRLRGRLERPVGVMLYRRLPGGDREYSLLVYDPARDAYRAEMLVHAGVLDPALAAAAGPGGIAFTAHERIDGVAAAASARVEVEELTGEARLVVEADTGWVPSGRAELLERVVKELPRLALRAAEEARRRLSMALAV